MLNVLHIYIRTSGENISRRFKEMLRKNAEHGTWPTVDGLKWDST